MSQPARDPADLRYLPARLGGTGQGFTRHGKAQSPVYLSAINPGRSLSESPDTTSTTPETRQQAAEMVTPEVVKARARIVTLRLLARIESLGDSMDAGDAVAALGQAGKLTGAITPGTGGNVTLNLGDLHLQALQAVRPAHVIQSVKVDAPMIAPVEDATIVEE